MRDPTPHAKAVDGWTRFGLAFDMKSPATAVQYRQETLLACCERARGDLNAFLIKPHHRKPI